MSVGKLVLSWANFEHWMETTVRELRNGNWDLRLVYGPPRGGNIPAVALAHRLNLLYCSTREELVKAMQSRGWGSENVLWVDDIVDSGKILTQDKALLPRATFISWVARAPMMAKFPTLRAFMVPEANDWLVFPWEDRLNWTTEMEEYRASRE